MKGFFGTKTEYIFKYSLVKPAPCSRWLIHGIYERQEDINNMISSRSHNWWVDH